MKNGLCRSTVRDRFSRVNQKRYLRQVACQRQVTLPGAAVECLPDGNNLAVGLDQNRGDLIGSIEPGGQRSSAAKSGVQAAVCIEPRQPKNGFRAVEGDAAHQDLSVGLDGGYLRKIGKDNIFHAIVENRAAERMIDAAGGVEADHRDIDVPAGYAARSTGDYKPSIVLKGAAAVIRCSNNRSGGNGGSQVAVCVELSDTAYVVER